MKIFDLEKWVFYLTALAIAVVFIFLTPTTQIIAGWFPGKTDRLWVYPGVLFSGGFIFWTVYRLSLSYLVRKGIFEDRRGRASRTPLRGWARIMGWVLPALRLSFQVLLLAGTCVWALAVMRSGWLQKLLGEISVRQGA